jgi:hypothetical protein
LTPKIFSSPTQDLEKSSTDSEVFAETKLTHGSNSVDVLSSLPGHAVDQGGVPLHEDVLGVGVAGVAAEADAAAAALAGDVTPADGRVSSVSMPEVQSLKNQKAKTY